MAPSEQSSNFSSSSMAYSSSASASADGSRGFSNFRSQSYQSYTDDKGNSYTSTTSSNPGGTTIRDHHRDPDGKETSQTRRLDTSGREIDGAPGQAQSRIEDVSDDRTEADRLYEERIEDEYAKREGGA